MKSSTSPTKINIEFSISLPVEEAFNFFVEKTSFWWPKEYTWAGEKLETIVIEFKNYGRCFERGPHNFECDWGRVLTFDPPNKIIFTWQIAPNRVPEPDPEKVSEIELQFEEQQDKKTTISFEHRNFDKHGEESEAYKQALSSPEGWPFILNRFKETAEK